MQSCSASSAHDHDGVSSHETAVGVGRHLWRQLIALAAVGVFSVTLLVFQVLDAQADARKARGARDQVASEIDAAKQQLQGLSGEVAAALARRSELAEHIIAAEKVTKRLESEVAALTSQRTIAASATEESLRRQQEAERRAVDAAQRQAAVEAQLDAARAELAATQARVSAAAKQKAPKRPRPNDHTP